MLVKINRNSGIPLIGAIQFGIIDRGTNLLQIRPTTVCNLKCSFCSTRAGDHETDFEIEVDYLLDWIKEAARVKGDNLIAFIESVGETLAYPKIIDLIIGIKKIKEFKEIILMTNGILLTKEKIRELKKAGVVKINLSIHSLDFKKSKELAGCEYNILHIIEMAEYIKEQGIELILTPVYIPNNEKDIEELIMLSKKLDCKIGIQKYEIHRTGRKLKNVKEMTYYTFYKKLKEWEKKFDIKLLLNRRDFDIEKRARIETLFQKGDKIRVEIKEKGWWKGQFLGIKNNRLITVIGENLGLNSLVTAKIIDNKDGIYIAKKL